MEARRGWAGSPRPATTTCAVFSSWERAVLSGLGEKKDRFSRWARSLVERRGYWRTVVAIAAKNARLAWAVLKYGEDFRLRPGAA